MKKHLLNKTTDWESLLKQRLQRDLDGFLQESDNKDFSVDSFIPETGRSSWFFGLKKNSPGIRNGLVVSVTAALLLVAGLVVLLFNVKNWDGIITSSEPEQNFSVANFSGEENTEIDRKIISILGMNSFVFVDSFLRSGFQQTVSSPASDANSSDSSLAYIERFRNFLIDHTSSGSVPVDGEKLKQPESSRIDLEQRNHSLFAELPKLKNSISQDMDVLPVLNKDPVFWLVKDVYFTNAENKERN